MPYCTNKELKINTTHGVMKDITTFPKGVMVDKVKNAEGGHTDWFAIRSPKQYANAFSHHDLKHHYVFVKDEDVEEL